MSLIVVLALCIIYFVVGVFSVSVGGTTLVMVPLLIYAGMDIKTAIATNMLVLIFLSLSGMFGFRKEIKKQHLWWLFLFVIITLISSFLGAKLVLDINEDILKKIIAVIIVLVASTLFVKKDIGLKENDDISIWKIVIGLILVFALGVYGGFFSGGYVTILTYVLILFFGLSFLQSAFDTKVINLFSSGIACVIFYLNDLIDFKLGLLFAIFISLGALLGVKFAIKNGNKWIRIVYIIAIIILAIKLLFF
ncbi:MAG: sulfite exporter TauE/SafE family protein [Patescibacteria group bacterium]|nr:sulfite exporter TauE/SafE family protein [Patescibacteria group bacterium]